MPHRCLPARCLAETAFVADPENDGANRCADHGVLPKDRSDFWTEERQASMHSGDLREEECDFIGESPRAYGVHPN